MMAKFKKQLISALCVSLVFSHASASVADLQKSSNAKRLAQVKDDYTQSNDNPGYQTNSLGGTWTPNISLNGASGKPTSINLDNASGTPAINVSRANGSLGGTTGLNASINNAINNQTQALTYLGVGKVDDKPSGAVESKVTEGQTCHKKGTAVFVPGPTNCSNWNFNETACQGVYGPEYYHKFLCL
ncbi:hypothetical protein [Vibrio sp. 1180_3]|uniref:hypothetical protein n=1 Tax=Vibrio sp. 1180_3 TaxID=2528832 RepID=UPI002404EECB|nr:hypothetical protein [Vibrio sp. 1180_3]MDF9399120.1 hypothetical protein [Vibrio sp. 1180_3]